jgi:hypothetical protein
MKIHKMAGLLRLSVAKSQSPRKTSTIGSNIAIFHFAEVLTAGASGLVVKQ